MSLQIRIDQQRAKEQGLKILAGIGLVAVLVAVAFGAIRIGQGLPSVWSNLSAAAVSLSSVFSPADKLTLTGPESVVSGNPFEISWTRRNSETGTYTVSYACEEKLSLMAENTAGSFENTFCNTPFNFGNAESKTRLLASAGTADETPARITVSFTPERSGARTVSDTIVVAVTGGKSATVTPGESPRQGTGGGNITTGPRQDNVYPIGGGNTGVPHGSGNKPDLQVTIISTGIVDRTTNAYSVVSPIRTSDRGAVRFSVENVGGVSSGSWTFAAVLPTIPLFTFNSESQRPLNPGDRIEFTLGFDSAELGTNKRLVINADPTQSVNEGNEDNNIKETFIAVIQ